MQTNYIDQSDFPNNLSMRVNRKVVCDQQYGDELLSNNNTSGVFPLVRSIGGEYQLVMSPNNYVEHENSTITVKEMIDKIRSVFGLNAIQVASLVGVSRPSLYNHIADKGSPKGLEGYKNIYNLATRVEAEISGDLKGGLKTVLVEGRTLLQYLKQKPLDIDQIMYVAKQVQSKLSASGRFVSDLSITEQRIKSRSITKSG